jgi:hypothetical protein
VSDSRRIYEEPEPYLTPGQLRARGLTRAVLTVVVIVVVAGASVLGAKAGAEVIMGQCAPQWLTGTDPQLCLDAHITAHQLTVSGTTSLPDGAIVEVWAEDFGTSYGDHWLSQTTVMTVSGGSFGGTFDLSSWGAGTVTVNALVKMETGQPAAVVDRYGPRGERLAGPDVQLDYSSGDPPGQAVQVSTVVDLSAG